MKKCSFIIAILFAANSLFAQSWFTPEVEQRAEQLLKNMTVREKLIYIGGVDWMFTKAIPRLGIPAAKMSDGPQGLGTWGASTAYPCALMLASTWNTDLAYRYGASLAQDCKARGVNILLGPGVNIYRSPMCGRNFEYMGEDPLVAAKTSTEYIKGLQANGVMGVVKHFTANFQEYDRNYISSDIDERTLHEIYFPAFKSAVQTAETGAIMTSYNLLNGVWTTENPWLLKEVLRNQWGFNGLVMSDWGSTHNCLPAATSGLDLEMAANEIENEDALRYYLGTGELKMSDIDLKVKHILQTLIAFGFFDRPQLDSNIPLDNPETAATALDIAKEGSVLLKNQQNILPLSSETVHNIAVIGNNATIYAAGGGSGLVKPFRYTTYFDGLKKLGAENGLNVVLVDKFDHLENVLFTSSTSNENGLVGEYFNNKDISGAPVAQRTDKRIAFEWTTGCDVAGVNKNDFSVRWTGEIRPQETAKYDFIVRGDDGFRLFINDEKVIDEYQAGAERERRYQKQLTAGTKYSVRLEYFQAGGGASIDFAWLKEGDEGRFRRELDKADVIVAFFGHNSSSEGEASDRSFGLPGNVQDLILEAQTSSTPMIGVVNAGGNIEMQRWEPNLKALIWAWYGGQDAGTAMAEILLGIQNPSGKLPVTFEKKWEDNPACNSYYDNGAKHVNFTEKIMIGYRGYDKNNTDVQYPFGFGLSYTSFEITDLNVETLHAMSLHEISCKIKNTGNRAGAQVIQLYVGKRSASPVERPVRELKQYEKVFLEPGEEQIVILHLNKDAFSYYSVEKKDFTVDNGEYSIELGFSSRDIKQQTNITIQDYSDIQAPVSRESVHLQPSVVKQGEKIRMTLGVARELNIYDLAGQLALCLQNTDVIDTAFLKQGVYLAHYKMKQDVYSDKFIVW
ncbi:MAG: glycoside hydrolase family 3 C-terminal domain-containing protein [Candidatus Symbiothrix sp.]|jgi:beta-glucosidase|nr:glycoside hydrolase family 3 C-terminal domain-containing protein [Candidatus Symbiothrix sp.]